MMGIDCSLNAVVTIEINPQIIREGELEIVLADGTTQFGMFFV